LFSFSALVCSVLQATPASAGPFAATPPPVFRAAPATATPPTPTSLAVGDLNADGLPDAVTGDELSAVDVTLRSADGALGQTVSYPVPGTAELVGGVAVADLNGDHALDIAASGSSQAILERRVWILLNDGHGAFTLAHTYDEAGSRGVVATNLDGVNGPDLALLGVDPVSGGPAVVVLPNVGDGNFGPQAVYPLGTSSSTFARSLGIADLTGDGWLDAVTTVAFGSPPQLIALVNQGDGTFGAPMATNLPAPVGDVVVKDFTGDHVADAVTQVGDSLVTEMGQGNGTFVPGPALVVGTDDRSLAAGDMNRDHRQDIILGARGWDQVFLGVGDGSFGPSASKVVGYDDHMVVADLDGDRWPDVMTAANPGAVSILRNDGHGRLIGAALFLAARTRSAVPTAITSGLLNEDRRPDLVVATSYDPYAPGEVSILLGRRGNQFKSKGVYGLPHGVTGIAVGDLGGDGYVDIALSLGAGSSHNVAVLQGIGHGDFASPTIYDIQEYPARIAIANVTSDAVPDLVMASENGDTGKVGLTVLPGLGGGLFGDPVVTVVRDGEAADLAVAQIDGAGPADVILLTDGDLLGVSSAAVAEIAVGDGSFTTGWKTTVPSRSQIDLADLNGDAHLDLLFVSETINGVEVFRGKADGTFSAAATYGEVSRAQALIPGDLNHDGFGDVAVTDTHGVVYVLTGAGDATLTLGARYFVAAASEIELGQTLAAADFDLDGRTDIAAANLVGVSVAWQTTP